MNDLTDYDNSFSETNVYGCAVELLASVDFGGGGVHLDFGCGYGRFAEVIRDRLGLRYIGLDINEQGLNSLKDRGFDVMYVDLLDPVSAIEEVRKYLPREEDVVSMSMLDTIEHLAEPEKVLAALRDLSHQYSCPLIASVPNFTHRDIGFRLAFGMFDYTLSGLLDHTHLKYFTESSFRSLMRSSGWHEVAANDVKLQVSDQSFPANHFAVALKTPLNQLLSRIREQSEPNGTVNQFVRMYIPGHRSRVPAPVDSVVESNPDSGLFLSVVMRTQGRRVDTLREALLCLSAQTSQDFEVLVVGHDLDTKAQLAIEDAISELQNGFRDKVRLVRVSGGSRSRPLNEGFAQAKGRYVVMLDDDDIVFGNWVEAFEKISRDNVGRLLRAVAVAQSWDKVSPKHALGAVSRSTSGPQHIYPDKFDIFDHLVENRTPLHSIAFPRSIWSHAGFRFDENLNTAEDWDFIMRVAPLCGVAVTKDVTCVYRRWTNSENSSSLHDQDEWKANYFSTLNKLDREPLLLPAGSTKYIREMHHELARLRHSSQGSVLDAPCPQQGSLEKEQERYLDAVRWRYHELITSFSWRATAPLRRIKSLLLLRRSTDLPVMVWRLSARDLEYMINKIESSSSWRMTSIIRRIGGG